MAFTVTPAVPTNAYVRTNLLQRDYNGEPARKGNLLYNSGGLYQEAMRAYESLSQPGIMSGAISATHVLSAQNTTATGLGQWPKSGDVLLLAFTREHPVASMAGTIITNEYAIVGPHPDIVGTVSGQDPTPAPVIVGGESFATASTRPEALGALIAWLENSLVVTVLKTRYAGGWSYDPIATRFINFPKQYDGQ